MIVNPAYRQAVENSTSAKPLVGSTHAECVGNPLALVSRPLFVDPRHPLNGKMKRWELPSDATSHPSATRFQEMLQSRKAFVLGGTNFLVTMGMLAAWYKDDATRKDAIKLIEKRKWDKVLKELRDKERGEHEIFGKKELSNFFQYFPPVDDREEAVEPRVDGNVMFGVRLNHPLRLRKAIEFIALTEAILRYRFSRDQSHNRFRRFTGVGPTGPEDALFTLEHMWIEPIIYTIRPLPRTDDVLQLMKQTHVKRQFTNQSGQLPGVLYHVLMGAPVKFATAEAAAAICNDLYPNGARTQAVTIEPAEYKRGMKVIEQDVTKSRSKECECVWELGPESITGWTPTKS